MGWAVKTGRALIRANPSATSCGGHVAGLQRRADRDAGLGQRAAGAGPRGGLRPGPVHLLGDVGQVEVQRERPGQGGRLGQGQLVDQLGGPIRVVAGQGPDALDGLVGRRVPPGGSAPRRGGRRDGGCRHAARARTSARPGGSWAPSVVSAEEPRIAPQPPALLAPGPAARTMVISGRGGAQAELTAAAMYEFAAAWNSRCRDDPLPDAARIPLRRESVLCWGPVIFRHRIQEQVMARKVQVLLEDDIDGTPGAETVLFSLDGKSYEIDLSEKNAEKLREAFAPWIGAGRRVSSPGGGRAASPSGPPVRGHRRHPPLGSRERHPGEHPRAHLRRPARPVRGRPLGVCRPPAPSGRPVAFAEGIVRPGIAPGPGAVASVRGCSHRVPSATCACACRGLRLQFRSIPCEREGSTNGVEPHVRTVH